MKKIVIVIIIAVIGAGAAYFLLLNDRISFNNNTPAFNAIPVDAPLFIEFDGTRALPTDNPILSELTRAGIFTSLFDKIHLIDTFISSTKEISNSLRNEKTIVVLTLEGRENIVPLFIIEASSGKQRDDLLNLVHLIYPGSKYSASKRTYNGKKIISLSSGSTSESFHYSATNGLFIASPKAILVEEAIRQLESASIMDNSHFKLVNKTATQQSKASVYINHKHFPKLVQTWINNETIKWIDEFGDERKTNYNTDVDQFANYAAWSELDFSINDEEIKLNGISLADDSLHNFLSVFLGQEPVKYKIDKALPKKTALFLTYSFSDKELFFSNLENFFSHSEIYYSREEAFKKMQSKSRIDIKELMKESVENEVALAFTNITNDPSKKNSIFVVSGKGQSQVKESFTNFLKKYAERNKFDYNSMLETYSVDKETKFLIYKFPFPSLPGIWLSGPFKSVSANYFTFWDNYIIFSSSKTALKDHLHDLVLDASLAKDIDYQKYSQNIDSRANINLYCNINLSVHLNKAFFNKEISKEIESKEDQFAKFGTLSFQVVNTNDLFFNSIYLNYLKEIKEDAKTTWQSNLGNEINMKPHLVINHTDRSNKEIIVQDKKDQLYQITKEGRIRWEIKLSGEILSEIHQIDFLKNGKYQYLFNTKDKLYLIDRNGNNVSPFPINLRAEATNGVSVFDYDNNRNYRYFIAGKDKKIYAYDRSGSIVSGWEFGKTDHEVNLPVQHFRVEGKDYIVFKDKSRIYIQNRQGATRVKHSVNFENSNNPLILNTLGTPKIVATDVEGKVYYLYFNGRFVKKKTPDFGEGHYFTTDDLDGNGILDFVFTDNNILTVINENGKKLYSKKLNSSISFPPNIYTFSSNLKKVGVVVASENRIYLYNPDGSLHQGFPLFGNSEFTIGKISNGSNNFNLIVGSDDGNIYNYSLNQ